MKQQAIIIIVALFIVIVAGMFGFAYVSKHSKGTPTVTEQPATSTNQYAPVTMITAKHFFQDGVHIFAGEIPMPTPCDLLQATSSVASAAAPQQVSLDFTVINNSQTCEQKVTNQRFKLSVPGNASTTFVGTFMGKPIQLNFLPAAAGETPDNFQLYQKG